MAASGLVAHKHVPDAALHLGEFIVHVQNRATGVAEDRIGTFEQQALEQDARAAYGRWVKEVTQQNPVDLKIIVLQVPPGNPQTAAARQVLAQDIAMRARRGDDFCELVLNYSEDPTTKQTCGSRGPGWR